MCLCVSALIFHPQHRLKNFLLYRPTYLTNFFRLPLRHNSLTHSFALDITPYTIDRSKDFTMYFSDIQHLSNWVTMTVLVGIVSSVTAAQLQFCRVNKSLRTDQCLAVSTFHNETSNSNDFYLLVSAKFENRIGYAAFGTGSTMDGSLMFVIYPGAGEKGIAQRHQR